MEPVTHILTGACLARTGLNRKAAYATLTMAIAAEFPDIDTLWRFRGPVEAFQHHRGITHTFLGLPVEAAVIVAGMYALHRWRVHRRRGAVATTHAATVDPMDSPAPAVPLTAAPVRWGLLYLFTLAALLSHLFLDYTNNYGVRPFFPFNPRWYAASITFIFDPLMFVLLLLALTLPALFRLIGSEVGARRQPFAPRGWAAAALLLVCALWGVRFVEHARAETLAMAQSYSMAGSGSGSPAAADAGPDTALSAVAPTILPAQRTLVSPDPINPLRWYSVVDFGSLYQLGTIDLRNGTYTAGQGTEPKLNPSPELTAAERSPLGRAYLDWSPMPFLDVVRAAGGLPLQDSDNGSVAAIVTFRDPRFLGSSPWLHRQRTRTPLTGEVDLDARRNVVEQRMDGKAEH